MEGGAEDARKKRDSDQVSQVEEKSKKLRSVDAAKTRGRSTQPTDDATGSVRQVPATKATNQDQRNDEARGQTVAKPDQADGNPPSWDIESASQNVVKVGESCKESLSNDTWVKFRVAHAEDASLLAACFNGTEPLDSKLSSDKAVANDETSLEVRLADGLGDEDTPPSIYAILGELFCVENPDVARLGAAALLTCSLREGRRVLRLEWLYLNNNESTRDILERRLWLRLSALSLLLSCEIEIIGALSKGLKAGQHSGANSTPGQVS